jgi:hypothetical protein
MKKSKVKRVAIEPEREWEGKILVYSLFTGAGVRPFFLSLEPLYSSQHHQGGHFHTVRKFVDNLSL